MKIFSGTTGLVNARSRFGTDYGADTLPLSSCSNVDVNDAGKLRRRGGTSLVLPATLGTITSLYPTYDTLAFVEGDALSVADRNLAVTRLRNVTRARPMSFVSDMYGRIFYANGIEHGFIENNVAYNWAPNVSTKGYTTAKGFGSPPIGHHLGVMGGRTIVAHDNFLYFSEPYNAWLYNLDENTVPIDSPARMIREVDGGLWVSTSRGIWFFAGRDFKTFDPIPRHAKPAIVGTDVECEASDLFDELFGLGVIVTTEDAVLFLTADGRAVNLSKDRVEYPAGAHGCAMIHDGRYLVQFSTIDPLTTTD